jgi:hypothetical protein
MADLLKLVSIGTKSIPQSEKSLNIDSITNLITNQKDNKKNNNKSREKTPDVSVYMDMTKELKERRKGSE